MPGVEASISVGDIEVRISARRRARCVESLPAARSMLSGVVAAPRGATAPQCLAFPPSLPVGDRIPVLGRSTVDPAGPQASALASAAVVRDVAALGALILFGTALALVLSSVDLLV